jgi:hypothetical protein
MCTLISHSDVDAARAVELQRGRLAEAQPEKQSDNSEPEWITTDTAGGFVLGADMCLSLFSESTLMFVCFEGYICVSSSR